MLLAINGDEPAMPPPGLRSIAPIGYIARRVSCGTSGAICRPTRRSAGSAARARFILGSDMRIDGQPEWVVIPLSTGLGLSLPLGLIAELLALAVFPALGRLVHAAATWRAG